MPQPPDLPSKTNPAGSPPVSAGFFFRNARGAFRGLPMLTAKICRDRAAECRVMAEHAPSPRVRDILIDMAWTWTRLALEAEQSSQLNRPRLRLAKPAPKNAAPSKPTLPTPLQPRGSNREPS